MRFSGNPALPRVIITSHVDYSRFASSSALRRSPSPGFSSIRLQWSRHRELLFVDEAAFILLFTSNSVDRGACLLPFHQPCLRSCNEVGFGRRYVKFCPPRRFPSFEQNRNSDLSSWQRPHSVVLSLGQNVACN